MRAGCWCGIITTDIARTLWGTLCWVRCENWHDNNLAIIKLCYKTNKEIEFLGGLVRGQFFVLFLAFKAL